jgi:hypothetical protein
MEFVGFSRAGARVLTCTANYMISEKGKAPTSAPCNALEEYRIGGATTKNPIWFTRQRDDDVARGGYTYARCSTHGPELVKMKPRKKEAD